MERKTLEIRGINRDRILQYLAELEGKPEEQKNRLPPSRITGKGWECTVSEEGFLVMMQSKIPRVSVTFSAADPDTLNEIVGRFRFKAFRAGG